MKQYIIWLIIMLFSQSVISQEFVIKSFEIIDNDLTAISSPRKDRNDEYCAIIKIYTPLSGLSFDSNCGFEGNIHYSSGEYILYVSHGEKHLKIMKEGIRPKDYIIEKIIESKKVYKIELGCKNYNQNNITSKPVKFNITSEPDGAEVYINGVKVGNTPFNIPYPQGKYQYKIKKYLYKEEAGSFNLNENNNNFNFKLKPNYGIIEIMAIPNADIYIDGKKQVQKLIEAKLKQDDIKLKRKQKTI